jgi:hypothetical protein
MSKKERRGASTSGERRVSISEGGGLSCESSVPIAERLSNASSTRGLCSDQVSQMSQ